MGGAALRTDGPVRVRHGYFGLGGGAQGAGQKLGGCPLGRRLVGAVRTVQPDDGVEVDQPSSLVLDHAGVGEPGLLA